MMADEPSEGVPREEGNSELDIGDGDVRESSDENADEQQAQSAEREKTLLLVGGVVGVAAIGLTAVGRNGRLRAVQERARTAWESVSRREPKRRRHSVWDRLAALKHAVWLVPIGVEAATTRQVRDRVAGLTGRTLWRRKT